MKKIWLISYSLDGVMAGPSIRFQRYAPKFAEKGYRLQFVTFSISKNLPLFEKREFFDVHRIRVGLKFMSRTRFISKSLFHIVRSSDSNPNVLTLSIATYQLWIVSFLKFFFGLKLYYINTMAPDLNFLKGFGFLGSIWNYVHKSLYRILYRALDGVICSTIELADQQSPLGVNSQNAIIINNGVDAHKFTPIQDNLKTDKRSSLGLPNSHKDRIFLFIGLKTERKGLKELCDSWMNLSKNEGDKFHNCYLVLLGNEKPGANSSTFNQWWINFKLKAGDFNIMNFDGVSEVNHWYQAADVFLFPSKKEGMPNVVLEAMSSGLALVTNKFEGYSDIYGKENITHMAFEHSENNLELIKTIEKINNSSAERLKLSRNARSYALDTFSIDNSINYYVDLFK